MARLDLDTPRDLKVGDRLRLQTLEDQPEQFAPPAVRVDTNVDPVVLDLGEGQPGPFLLPADQPVTVDRG